MKSILLAVFSASYAMAANPLENENHHYMTVYDEYGSYHRDDLSSYSGGGGYKIDFFNLTTEHDITYISDKRKVNVLFRNCIQKAKKIEIISVAKENIFTFEKCSEDFLKTNIIFKRNPYGFIDENLMSIKIIFKQCPPIPEDEFSKNLLSQWNGTKVTFVKRS